MQTTHYRHESCGCYVDGDGKTAETMLEVKRCAKHDAAPDLLDALKALLAHHGDSCLNLNCAKGLVAAMALAKAESRS